jgi:copper(I)-binding protein
MKMYRWTSLGVALAVALSYLAWVPAASADSHLRIEGAWARPGVAAAPGQGNKMSMAGNSAVYMEIHNAGPNAERLTAVASNVAGTVELHRTTMVNGMSRMSRVNAIVVPARGKVELKPGGYHVMLIGLKRALNVGDHVDVTLTFAHGGKIKVTADVKMPK